MSLSPFRALFEKRERAVLYGNRNVGLIILTLILTTTFIALGHAVGGMKDLTKRMNNPFTNWVNLPLTGGNQKEAQKVLDYFDNPELLDSFNIMSIGGYTIRWEFVNDKSHSRLIDVKTRSVLPEEELLKAILAKDNILYSTSEDPYALTQSSYCWVIIKESMIDRLGFSGPESLTDLTFNVIWDNKADDGKFYQFYTPVVAVVKELPNRVEAIMPYSYQRTLEDLNKSDAFSQSRSNNLQLIAKGSDVEGGISSVFPDDIIILDSDATEISFNGSLHTIYEIYMDTSLTLNSRNHIVQDVVNQNPNIYRYDQLNCIEISQQELARPQYLTFNFLQLDKVALVKEIVLDKFGLEISMNQVRDKENFSKVTLLTISIIFILLLFSILSIVIYLYNILRNHLEKIKSNLGTLKAFGMNDITVVQSYRSIVIKFFLLSTAISFGIAFLYGLIGQLLPLEFNFQLISLPLLLSWMLIFIFVFVISNYLLKSTIKHTPGDLIYNRK